MFGTPQFPTIHLGWLAPGPLAPEPYREVFERARRAYGWAQIVLDEGSTGRGGDGLARVFVLWQPENPPTDSPGGKV